MAPGDRRLPSLGIDACDQTMQTPWKDLFRLLAKETPSTVAYWYMRNGAEFCLTIPKEQDILDNTFSATIGFPFTFDEIEALRIPRRVRNSSITNDIDLIATLLKSIGGINWHKASDELKISQRS
jgi:hypothetical protein